MTAIAPVLEQSKIAASLSGHQRDRALHDARIEPALERHYSAAQIAELWGWSGDKVRSVFRDEPGVLQTRHRTMRGHKRQNVMLRIPESVVLRVHARLRVAG